MQRCFTTLLISGDRTATVAPLDAGTLLDVQICPCSVSAPLPPFGDLGTVGLTIDGTEVLPVNFPLRWLLQELTPGDDRYPDRRLALNCWGAGSRIEIILNASGQRGAPSDSHGDGAEIPQGGGGNQYMAVFRYETAPTPFLGTPYRYHVAKKSLSDLLARSSPMQSTVLQREMLRGAAVGVAVDWDTPSPAAPQDKLSADLAGMGIFTDAQPTRRKGLLDGLTVRVDGTMTSGVSAPLGIARPSQQQNLEDSLLRLPPQFGNTVAVSVTPPRKVFIDRPQAPEELAVEFTSVVIERVKERSRK